MTINQYQKEAMRTASGKCRSLANCAMGLAGEAGECTDIIKKHLFHDHELDREHLATVSNFAGDTQEERAAKAWNRRYRNE